MKLTIKVQDNDLEQLIEINNVKLIEFEDQRKLKNGMWLKIFTDLEKEPHYIEFEPDYDTFFIEN